MSERTEEQIITMEPFKSSIGGKLVAIPILRAGKAMEWKKEWSKAVFDYQETVFKPEDIQKLKGSDEDILMASLSRLQEMLIGAQEKVLELVCSYADKTGGVITRNQILNNAWDEEIKVLWEKISEVMFTPLATSLAGSMTTKKQ